MEQHVIISTNFLNTKIVRIEVNEDDITSNWMDKNKQDSYILSRNSFKILSVLKNLLNYRNTR